LHEFFVVLEATPSFAYCMQLSRSKLHMRQ